MKLHEMTLDQLRAVAYEISAERDSLNEQLNQVKAVIALRKAEATPQKENT
jgi:hypothetical protein